MTSVVFGSDGALYGTAYASGAFSNGSVFRVTTQGTLTILASFATTNGAKPRATLLLGRDGAFYGTTTEGGTNYQGTVFRVTTNGELTALSHFKYPNGYYPRSPLAEAGDGALYGTTAGGGIAELGSIFRITTNGVLNTVAEFSGPDGSGPASNLIFTEDGCIYGTTRGGGYTNLGSSYSSYGFGTVFRLSPDGMLTNLTKFAVTNGANPLGKFVLAADGAFYGTTQSGKAFRVTTNGALGVVADFRDAPVWSTLPLGGLEVGSDGAFYGTTEGGGDFSSGTVFRLTMNGQLTILASLAATNGAKPSGGLVEGKDGAFYGTTPTGGSLGGGNVFRIQVFSHIESVNRVGNGWLVKFSGVEGETYRLLRSTNISGPWDTLTNIALGADRHGEYLDTDPPAGGAFYKTVTP